MTRCRFGSGCEMHLAVVPRIGDIMSLLNVRHCLVNEDGHAVEWFDNVRGRVTQVIWMNNAPGLEPMAHITLDQSDS